MKIDFFCEIFAKIDEVLTKFPSVEWWCFTMLILVSENELALQMIWRNIAWAAVALSGGNNNIKPFTKTDYI